MRFVSDFDPFGAQNLIKAAELSTDTSITWPGFCFEAEPANDYLKLDATQELKLAPFRTSVLGLDAADTPLTTVGSSTGSRVQTPDSHDENELSTTEDTGSSGTDANDTWDVWSISKLLSTAQENKLISWDHFTDQRHEEPTGAFISEVGSATFDQLLQKCLNKTHDKHIRYAKPDVFVHALFDLGLGRSSAIFAWNASSQRFDTSFENFTVTGLSRESLQHVMDQFLDAGTQFRRLRLFEQLPKWQSPMRIALRTSLRSILDTIERVAESSRHRACTTIQLRDIFHETFLLLAVLDQLVKELGSIRNDVDLIEKIALVADDVVLKTPQFNTTVQNIVSQTLQPWLQDMEAELGLLIHDQPSETNAFEILSMLVPDSTVHTFRQVQETLRLLQQSDVNRMPWPTPTSDGHTLSLDFSLEDISKSQQTAFTYEYELQKSIVKESRSETGLDNLNLTHSGITSPKGEFDPFSLDADLFSGPLMQGLTSTTTTVTKHDLLQTVVAAALTSRTKVSIDEMLFPRQAIDLSISPMVYAQYRLCSYSLLQLLFDAHHFVAHTQLLGRFQLLSDGSFTSKLSTALFDSSQVSGEGRLVTHGRTGLRLQSRETWPPATSELRLALMGILTESMSTIKNPAMTESISFAIRDLADEDLERCRDIDSIYALDFLRLSYRAPASIIEAAVTPQILDKYDLIFNQLLRLLRMKALAQSILRSDGIRASTTATENGEQKFRVEIQQFVVALGEYCQNVAIKTTWHAFETKLKHIQERLDHKDYTGTLHLAGGLETLRELHENTLDAILRGLLLKRRQSEAKGIVDRLFEVILRFTAATSKSTATTTANARRRGREYDDDENNNNKTTNNDTTTLLARLRKDFEMHMRALVRWLQNECGRADNDGNEMFEQLLLKLDWNGYWSR